MKKYRLTCLFYIVVLLLPIALLAQEKLSSRYNVTYITMDEGLPHNFVDDIYKDSHGFLWIAMSGGGLSRYDGNEFINFTLSTPRCKLKSNFIRNIYEDRFQRLWTVSEGGTDIIDLKTMQSVMPRDRRGLLSTIINKPASYILRDSQGCIWLYCSSQLHRIAFDGKGDIKSIHTMEIPGQVNSDIVFKDIDHDGKIWMPLNGRLYKIGINAQGGLQKIPLADCLSFAPDILFTDFIAKENEIWMATNVGLYRYNRNENIIKRYTYSQSDPYSISQNYVTNLAITNDSQLMVASLKGINVYNPIKDNFERIGDWPANAGALRLNSNFINCIFVEGKHVWIGTESGGINKLTYKRLSSKNYRNVKEDPSTLSANPVNAIYEDIDGNLWVGTVEGGLNMKEPGSDRFTHYTFENGALGHNSVSAITADLYGHLWVGTWGGGISLLDRNNPRHNIEILSSENNGNFPINFVGALEYDPINNGMWIGANQGLFFYDFSNRRLSYPFANRAAENIRGCIGSLIDKSGKLWIGCLDGVYIVDLHSSSKTSSGEVFQYRHLKYKLDDPASKLIEKICCFCEAKDGTLWLGSNGYGIYKRIVDKQGRERFIAYNDLQGLPNNNVRSILEDDKGCLWVATNNGLSRFQPSIKSFINYTRQDGLSDTQFYWNAACRSARNKLYFGNVAGLVAVDCELPVVPMQPSQLCFTRLIVGNKEILPSDGQFLSQDISVTGEICIHEREKSFSLEFSGLDFEENNTPTYSYRLVGFDNKWIQVPGNRRFASYTNLSPGKYTFQVKYSSYNRDGNPTEKMAELNIIIEPYFYKTIWFIFLMVLMILFAVWQFYQWRIRSLKRQKERLHSEVEQRTNELNEQKQLLEQHTEVLSRQNQMLKQQNEKITRQKVQLTRMAHKVQELTLDKIAFFTNITHEFRTPITLIVGPIERALKLSSNPQVIEQLHFVERNSKYLLSLVNQLMDFRKVESAKLKITKIKGDFLKFADELIVPFEAFAQERNIQIKRYSKIAEPMIVFDEDSMRKVFTNLLSNAIKFTPNGGRVSLFIALLPSLTDQEERLYICVSDTGSGIPEEDITKIFNRFYQSHGQIKYPMYGQTGSGIGLYLCKRIVQMQGGKIWARNNRSMGCSFRILLPLTVEKISTAEVIAEATVSPEDSDEMKSVTNGGKADLSILVVEDNADMRGYIRSILQQEYNVLEASDGAEALNILSAQSIDFIISDLMMPVMDGLELSRRVKADFSISHIPFLMLTAKTSPEARLESYRIGVDEYLLKPFDETLLLTRIENIIETRRRYQQKFALNMDVECLNMEEESGDKKFISRVMEVLKEHYKDPYFEVSDFCEAVGVSKSQLNLKLQSLVGQPAKQFIRNYRLNLAYALILKNRTLKNRNISEIAYEVGFNDPKYFARCFVRQYKMKPSELLNEEE